MNNNFNNLDLDALYAKALDVCSLRQGSDAFRLNFGVYYTPKKFLWVSQ